MACPQARLLAKSKRGQTQVLAQPQQLHRAQWKQTAEHQRQTQAMPASPARLQPPRGGARSVPRSESCPSPPRSMRPQAGQAALQLLARFQHAGEERMLRATQTRCPPGLQKKGSLREARSLGQERGAPPHRERSCNVSRSRTCPTAAIATLSPCTLRCWKQ